MLPQFFARRYLFSPKSRSVVNLISGLSVVAVAMPVAAMIILLSVFNGFESLVKSMYSAFDADLTVSARLGQTFPADAIDTAAVARIPGVEAFSFVLEQSALLEHAGRQATATVRGVDDAYAAAAAAFGEWGRTTPSERQQALLKFADAITAAGLALYTFDFRSGAQHSRSCHLLAVGLHLRSGSIQ